ncbi:MAG: hypothetical protein STHCBS139747_004661 [Sporothrix thermara]
MSAYSDSVAARAYAKATMEANKASSSSSSTMPDTSTCYPAKDNETDKPQKSSSLKNWTKNLISDLGKSPADTKNDGSNDNRPTKI